MPCLPRGTASAPNLALASGLDDLAARFIGKRILAVTTHRRENFEAMTGIASAIADIAKRPDVAVIFPVHPNPNVRARDGHVACRTR